MCQQRFSCSTMVSNASASQLFPACRTNKPGSLRRSNNLDSNKIQYSINLYNI